MNRRILIVDDDANLRRTLTDILRFRGFEPIDAGTGAEAVSLAANEKPAVALIDLRLEDMPGLQVLQRIKEEDERVACIVLTGHASQRSAIDAVNLGAYSYVQKPYNVDQLLLTIQRAAEKQEADEALRESQALLSATGKMAKVGGWEIDAKTGTLVWTEELYRIHEVAPDYVPTAEKAILFYKPEGQATIHEAISAALETGQAFDLELPVVTATGKELWVHVLGQAEYRGDEITKVSGTFQDITDRKAAETALRQTNRRLEETLSELHLAQEQMIRQERLAAVGQLSAGLAHEYNNIMATIILYADMMLRTSDLPLADRERLTAIYDQGRRAAALTQQILDFSRRAILRKQETEITPFLRDLQQHLKTLLPRQIHVSLQIPREPMRVWIDRERMQQAMVNLALNARDAMMPEGGDLDIKARALTVPATETAPAPTPELAPGVWIAISITDTGTGISEEALQHIWEPFFTTHGPTSSGLGLPQVFGIVSQHDGHVAVQTEEGRGSTFSIYLPATSQLMEDPDDRGSLPEGQSGHGNLALIIERHTLVREALVAALNSLNTASMAAHSVEAALQKAERSADEVRLVLSDVADIELRGLSLIQDLKRRFPAAQIVLIGDQIPNQELRAMVRSGAVRWLEKPLDLAKLTEVVTDIDVDRAAL